VSFVGVIWLATRLIVKKIAFEKERSANHVDFDFGARLCLILK